MKYVVYSLSHKDHSVTILGISDTVSAARKTLHESYSAYTRDPNMEIRIVGEDKVAVYRRGYVYNSSQLVFSIVTYNECGPLQPEFIISETSLQSVPEPPPQNYMAELKLKLEQLNKGEQVLFKPEQTPVLLEDEPEPILSSSDEESYDDSSEEEEDSYSYEEESDSSEED